MSNTMNFCRNFYTDFNSSLSNPTPDPAPASESLSNPVSKMTNCYRSVANRSRVVTCLILYTAVVGSNPTAGSIQENPSVDFEN